MRTNRRNDSTKYHVGISMIYNDWLPHHHSLMDLKAMGVIMLLLY